MYKLPDRIKQCVARKKCIGQPDTHENGALRPIRRASGFWSNVAASGSFVDAQKSSCMGGIMGVILGEDGFKYFESIGAFVNAFFIFLSFFFFFFLEFVATSRI